jgi:hypothetical protein
VRLGRAECSNLNVAEPKALSLQLHGATYSDSSIQQSLNLTLFCDPDKTSEPDFIAYDGTRLDIEWHAPAACAFKEAPTDDKEGGHDPVPGESRSVGSGIGWFFLV